MADLSELEEHILHRLASTRVTPSSVALAAELWEGDSSPFTFDMVCWILKFLNKEGFITYRITGGGRWYDDESGRMVDGELPLDIRVTDHGYRTLGYGGPHQIIDQLHHGSKGDSIRPGDPTDFRNLRFYAPFEPCEVMTIAEHRQKYPDHQHPPEWWGKEVFVEEEVATQIQESVSQRNRILLALQVGPAKSVIDLRRRIGREIDEHSLAHLVWGLQKAALVTFSERGKDLRLIRLTAVGKQKVLELTETSKSAERKSVREAGSREVHGRRPIGRDMTDPRNHRGRTTGGPIQRSYIEPYRDPEEETPMVAQNERVETDLDKIEPYFVPGYTNVHAKTAFQAVEMLDALGRAGTQTEIARMMGKGVPTVIQQVKAAVHWGWIEEAGKDGNARMLRVSDLGRELLYANKPKTFVPDRISDLNRETPPHIVVDAKGARFVPVIDEAPAASSSTEASAKTTEDARKDGSTDTHTQYRNGGVDVDKFPIIADLMTKETRLSRYEAAIKLLEDDDQAADIAVMLLDKIQLSDLEKEVIRFIKGLGV